MITISSLGAMPMKVSDIEKKLLARIPRELAEDWDNVGLILGDGARDVSRAALSLDADERTVLAAADAGCALLITHHPAIFHAARRFLMPDPTAAMMAAAMSCGVSIISLHTNWDSSPDGVNAVLSRLIGLTDTAPLEGSMGAAGRLPEQLAVRELARRAKDAWGLSWTLVYGDGARIAERAALCGGAGGSLLDAAIGSGADVYITADVSYHHITAARTAGMSLIVCGHGEMEAAAMPELERVVRETCGLETIYIDIERSAPEMI